MMKRIFESERIDFVEVSEQLVPDYLVMVNDVENVQRFLAISGTPFTKDKEVSWVNCKLSDGSPVRVVTGG